MAWRVQHLRRAAQLVGAICGEEALDRGPAFRGAQIAARGLAVLVADGQRVARLVERVRSVASRSFRISIRKRIFGKYAGAAGSKPEGPFSIA